MKANPKELYCTRQEKQASKVVRMSTEPWMYLGWFACIYMEGDKHMDVNEVKLGIGYDSEYITELFRENIRIVCPYPEAEGVLRNLVDEDYLKLHINRTFDKFFIGVIGFQDFSNTMPQLDDEDWNYLRNSIGDRAFILFKHELDHICSEDVITHYIQNMPSLTVEQEKNFYELLVILNKHDERVGWYIKHANDVRKG